MQRCALRKMQRIVMDLLIWTDESSGIPKDIIWEEKKKTA